MRDKPLVGLYLEEDVPDIKSTLEECTSVGFGFICCKIVTEENQRKALYGTQDGQTDSKWVDLDLEEKNWRLVGGILSNVQGSAESEDVSLRDRACNIVKEELNYAGYMGFGASIVNLEPEASANFTRTVASVVKVDEPYSGLVNLWVRIPLLEYGSFDQPASDLSHNREGVERSWNIWNRFILATELYKGSKVVLNLPKDFPETDDEVDRWLGEPVSAVCVCEDSFQMNENGKPVLLRKTKQVVEKFIFACGSHIILVQKEGKRPKDYKDHLDHLKEILTDLKKKIEEDAAKQNKKANSDWLVVPLQPLRDNIQASHYFHFQRDRIKYARYEDAIANALFQKAWDKKIVIVVGAGRGPLVTTCIELSKKVDQEIKVIAIEKNPNAVRTLQHLNKTEWEGKVTIVEADMRDYNPEFKADLIVSELLGSFGDNELSPECLDGAQRFLKDDGIMIPARYSSHIAPVMTSNLHRQIHEYFLEKTWAKEGGYESPYCALMRNFYLIDQPQELFTFVHPNPDVREHNDRYRKITFKAKVDCMMHGIAGYFDSDLYDGAVLSILPKTHTATMTSWYSMFFPLKIPMTIKKGDDITINFWRLSDKHRVWYEWSVSTPNGHSMVHNLNGKSYEVGK